MKKYTIQNLDWWKWGTKEKRKSLTDYPKLMRHLEERWGLKLSDKFAAANEFTVLSETDHSEILTSVFSKFDISTNPEARLVKTLGKSYKDLLIGTRGHALRLVDAVITPKAAGEVREILEVASRENIIVVPFGGGSNVVSDFELPVSEKRAVVALDLKALSHKVNIDLNLQTATFQAGIYGPELEKILNAQGMSLGHFPQSFEYSTLGGWIVTRSAGQESSAYGRIEDLVISIQAQTPVGEMTTSRFEGDAAGINLKSLFFGSEGTLGVVTEATVRIHPIPEEKDWVIGVFPTFQDGLRALKQIVQNGLTPSVVRFSDESETFFLSLLSSSQEGFFTKVKETLKEAAFKIKNIREPSIMMIRFDDLKSSDHSRSIEAREIFSEYGALLLGQQLGKKWEHSRYGLPYLRDDLVERSIVVDTMETVFSWDEIEPFRKKLKQLLAQSQAFQGERGILLTHVSHVYPSCASMYFTVLTPMNIEDPMKQWIEIKNIVTEAIVSAGGACSHHHGVGRDHQHWLVRTTDSVTQTILANVKKTVDPKNILNPGKLFDEQK